MDWCRLHDAIILVFVFPAPGEMQSLTHDFDSRERGCLKVISQYLLTSQWVVPVPLPLPPTNRLPEASAAMPWGAV